MELRKRTRLAGLSMVVGGLAMTVPPFLGPPNGADDTRQRLTDLAANPTPSIANSLVFQAVVLLILPGVAAIIGRTTGRGSGIVVSGGVVYGAGLVGAFGFLLMNGVEVTLAGHGAITAALVDADDRMSSSPAAIPAFVLALLCFHFVGLPWLTLGMVRARQIPWWLATISTIGTLLAFFGSGTNLETVGWIVLGFAIAAVGSTVARPAIHAPRTPTAVEAQPA
jgi:hypothetical protein